MIYKVDSIGEKLSITFKGRLTFAEYNSFRQVAELVGTVENQVCTFDIKELEYIDSAGLGMLLLSREKAQETNSSIILQNPSGQVKKMLEIGKFENLFVINHIA
jgi:anti-anti-sigma factor